MVLISAGNADRVPDEAAIIEIACRQGATVAGIAAVGSIGQSPSQQLYPLLGRHQGIDETVDGGTFEDQQKSDEQLRSGAILVIGLVHPEDQPELDWWDGQGTPGNRQLIAIAKRTGEQVRQHYGIVTRCLPYYVEQGGIFLKDAAVLAGLGCIGRNNLLVTPKHGPRLRLRAIHLDVRLSSTGPLDFDPCAGCPEPCRQVCPQQAFTGGAGDFPAFIAALPARNGAYLRKRCDRQMNADEAATARNDPDNPLTVRYCRRCELACPVGYR